MQQFGEAEIQYLHLTAGGQEDVCRLDIPMHDPFGMRRGQSVRHLDADIEHLLRLHEGMSVVVLDTVDGADIGMVQQRRGSCFPLESFQRFGVARKIFWDELQRDVPPQFQVLSLVYDAHATAPELAQDAVVGYGLANHERATLPTAVMLGPWKHQVNSGVESLEALRLTALYLRNEGQSPSQRKPSQRFRLRWDSLF